MTTSVENRPPLTAADVPLPILQAVINPTDFKVEWFNRMGRRHEFFDVIVVKGSFELQGGELIPCKEQAAIIWADEYWDNNHAEVSSLRRTADIELIKPSTDVLVTGTVKSFEAKPRKEWGGMLRVTRRNTAFIQKTLRFTGPRRWTHGFVHGWTLSEPESATEVSLRYELAYGGYWTNPKEKDPELAREAYAQNPSGSGHFGKSHDTGRDYPGPQIELHPKIIDEGNRGYVPGGFGPIARFWQPRAKYGGTYDDAWFKQFHKAAQADCIPDYPRDFDYRHFQAAPADQITPEYLRGDEWIELAGLFDDVQAKVFQLPNLAIHADLYSHDEQLYRQAMKLDTVQIDLDTSKVFLTWRLTVPQRLNVMHAELDITTI